MIPQSVIEKIALPIHAVFPGHKLFPISHCYGHARLARKSKNGMQMVRHEQAQPAMPDEFLVIMLHGCKHRVAGAGLAQLILSRRHALDGDKKNQLPSATHCGIV